MQRPSGRESLKERAKDLMAGPNGEPERHDDLPADEGKDRSIWERVEQHATIAPIQGDPDLVPANEPWEVAMMAGWGSPEGDDRGHDTFQGVDEMVLGNVDANRELHVGSSTRGGPLELADGESCFDDRRGTGVMDMRLAPEEDPRYHDWCSHL